MQTVWDAIDRDMLGFFTALARTWGDEVLILVAALLLSMLVAQVVQRVRIQVGSAPQRALAGYLAADAAPVDAFAWNDRDAAILLSLGLPPDKRIITALRVAALALPTLLLLLGGMPPVAALGGGALCLVLVHAFLLGRWRKLRIQIEAELPTFVSRLAGTLLVTASPLKALSEVTDTLDADSPLRRWLERLRAGVRMESQAFFDDARREAAQLSPSLALVVFQLGRFFETGGAGFARSFTTTAEELSAILEARAVAGSKAESARGAVLTMLAIMGVILFLLLSSPSIRLGFRDPVVQTIAAVSLAAMGAGYALLNSMIDEALDG
jgi:hypothetical protein